MASSQEVEDARKSQQDAQDADEASAEGDAEASKSAAEGRANTEIQQPSGGQVTVYWKSSDWVQKNRGTDWIKGVGKPPEGKSDIETPSRDREGEGEGEGDYQLRGLRNFRQACFANAAVQFLNSALTYDQIHALRGSQPLSLFSLKYKDFMWDEPDKKLTLDDRKELEKLRSNIGITAAVSGQLEIAPYLGQLLLDMRKGVKQKPGQSKSRDMAVTPAFFQQVFAYGCGLNKDRNLFNGEKQEDAQEYLAAIIDTVIGEGHTFMRDLFKVKRSITTKCTNCGNESKADSSALLMGLRIAGADKSAPEDKEPAKALKLREVLNAGFRETHRLPGATCKKCDTAACLESTESVDGLSGNVIVHLNRATGATGAAVASAATKTRGSKAKGKDATTVELDFDGTQFEFDNGQYELAVVVRHDGKVSTSGHYTALVKHNGTWNSLNDRKMEEAPELETMKDDKETQCSIVLLRKMMQ